MGSPTPSSTSSSPTRTTACASSPAPPRAPSAATATSPPSPSTPKASAAPTGRPPPSRSTPPRRSSPAACCSSATRRSSATASTNPTASPPPSPARSPPGAEVLNAAVPTWGPPESVRALADLAPTYRPETVVFTANLANDWTEVRVPNARRTTARDGFAAYRLHDAPEVSDFPGRAWLFGRSHLFLAVRRLRAAAAERPPETAAVARRLLSDLPHLSRPDGPHRSRLTASLLAAQDICRPLGCRVVLLALPLDLQVHPSEWAKYQGVPFDLRPTEVLLDHLLSDAARHHIPAVDLRPPLRTVSPGAFLADDYHLSATGHAAVAAALAPVIVATAPAAAPTLAAESAR